MSVYFKPYEGSRPYLFISYSHRDSEVVLETISRLNDRKLRLWYDEGIPAGSDWPKNIEQHMQNCSMVLFFASETALASVNCRSEIETALALKKPVLLLSLAPTEPDPVWQRLLSACTALPAPSDPAARADAVLDCRRVTRAFFRKPLEHFRFDGLVLAMALLLFAAAAAGLYALMTGRLDSYFLPAPTPSPTARPTPAATAAPTPSPKPTATPYIPGMEKVTFPDGKQEDAVREALDRPSGDITLSDLGSVTELHFCGTMVLKDPSDARFVDGAYRVNTARPVTGPITDLSVIGSMPYLSKLSLILQPVRSLADLQRLVLLSELSLAGCEGVDLSTLPALPSLTTLRLEHSGVGDLAPLSIQPALRTVTVSADMLPLSFPDDAAYDVVLVP